MAPESAPHPLRFLVDAMLGNAARDLRLLGFDALYAGQRTDSEILRLCQKDRRVLVTRDRGLASRAANVTCVFVREGTPARQILEVVREVGIDSAAVHPFTRCIRCNAPLRLLSGPEARSRLPDHVANGDGPFRACDSCGRTYWPGTHLRHLERRVHTIAEALQVPRRPV